jgi:hypothetical protein
VPVWFFVLHKSEPYDFLLASFLLSAFVLEVRFFYIFRKWWILIVAASASLSGYAAAESGWFTFDPPLDRFEANCPIDLRSLNEAFAGEHGYITARGAEFIHPANQQPVRFWGVNGFPANGDSAHLRQTARMLAKRGVNLVRLHGAMFDDRGEVDRGKINHAFEAVAALKSAGIYSHFSIYFPLWLNPKPDNAWLQGYNGSQHPFAALLFNKDFQQQYRSWWRALLLTRDPVTGKALIEEPAVFGLEIQNEDSFFFWTFSENNIPDQELRILEGQFADWLAKKYGSIEKGVAHWNGLTQKRDNLAEKRLAFRPLYNMFTEKTVRDADTVQFLFETQRNFYAETYKFLRDIGFKGVITASNWATASPEVFGPLEKLSYTVGDFVDRHGYFSSYHKGKDSEWSIRDGHTYSDRSALKFEGPQPGKPKQFVHPSMDPTYSNKPSMISETTWNRPNRFRSEAPLFFAAYGALQGSDAIVHFAFDGDTWSVKPGYFMQPWTLMSPAMMGQFPAAALIFREGLIPEGKVLATINLNPTDLLQLKGTPLPQDAALDELRLKDVPHSGEVKLGQLIDPLIHFAGRVEVTFENKASKTILHDLTSLIDREKQTVRSPDNDLRLDYGKGLLVLDAPRAQGISGNLGGAGEIDLADVTITSSLTLGHIVVVALDNQPISSSARMLLQAMSEEKSTGFTTEPLTNGVMKIANIGHNPWTVKDLTGTVHFKRETAKPLRIQPLDYNGYPAGQSVINQTVKLETGTLYYLITR